MLQESSTEEEEGGLKILDDESTPLDMDDMEDLNPAEKPMDMDASDYDVLS